MENLLHLDAAIHAPSMGTRHPYTVLSMCAQQAMAIESLRSITTPTPTSVRGALLQASVVTVFDEAWHNSQRVGGVGGVSGVCPR